MSKSSRQLVYELEADSSIKIDYKNNKMIERSLYVSFKRTIRVSDNDTVNRLPPDLGNFPLSEVSDYESLPSTMKAKKCYFMPMHRKVSSEPIR